MKRWSSCGRIAKSSFIVAIVAASWAVYFMARRLTRQHHDTQPRTRGDKERYQANAVVDGGGTQGKSNDTRHAARVARREEEVADQQQKSGDDDMGAVKAWGKDWAKNVSSPSVITAYATALTAVLTFFVLYGMYKAHGLLTYQLTALTTQNDIARDHFEKTQAAIKAEIRAWVVPLRWTNTPFSLVPDKPITLMFTLKSSGPGIAQQVKAGGHHSLGDRPIDNGLARYPSVHYALLGPGETFEFPISFRLTASEIKQVMTGKQQLFLAGTAHYRDRYFEGWFTHFCVVYKVTERSFRMCSTHNYAY